MDGENFRHTIEDLFTQFRKEDYLPHSANWADLFDWIVSQGCTSGERLRTYWYVIKMLDVYPYNLPNPNAIVPNSKAYSQLETILTKYAPYQTELSTLAEPQKTTRMIDMLKELYRRDETIKKRFDGWIAVQEGISAKHKGIEFRRAGAIKYDAFTKTLGGEKAVDVKLAVDMITLKDIYDVAMIVSGDQDYVPAVEVIKDSGKQVVNVAFTTRSGDLLPGGARRLNQVVDWHCNITYSDFHRYLNI